MKVSLLTRKCNSIQFTEEKMLWYTKCVSTTKIHFDHIKHWVCLA